MKETTNQIVDNTMSGTDISTILDETTQEVVDEYSRKLLSLIQQEKERVRKYALTESEKILAEADRKAKSVYEKVIKSAESESNAILSDCTTLKNQMSEEVERFSRIMVVLKEKTSRQVADLSTQLQREVEVINHSLQKTESTILEIKTKLDNEFNESAAMLNDLKQRILTLSDSRDTKNNLTKRPDPPPEPQPAREDKSTKVNRREERSNTKQTDKQFTGTINFEIVRSAPALTRRFREALAKIPGIEISMTDDSLKDRSRIVAFANRPVAIIETLLQMTLVKNVIAIQDSTLEIVLQDSDRWVG